LGALLAMAACSAAATATPPKDGSMQAPDAIAKYGDAESTTDARDDPDTSDTGPAAVPDAAGDADTPVVDVADATDNTLGVGLDATDLDAAGPNPPPSACAEDAGNDAGLCPPPRSVCADQTWLVYYDNGQCVSGQCTWEKRYIRCSVALACWFGACQGSITAAQ
jgi:hypothetical protein